MTPIPVFLFALAREHLYFLPRFSHRSPLADAPGRAWLLEDPRLLIVETGIGRRRTLAALDWLRQRYLPSHLVFSGFAGALSDRLRLGDVMVVSKVIDEQGLSYAPTFSIPGATRGRLLTSTKLISMPEEKRDLYTSWQADAVDMESASFARWCQAQNVPWACVRVISDEVQTSLSPELVAMLGQGQVSISRVLLTLLRRPKMITELWRLGRDTKLAARRLSKFLIPIVSGRIQS